MLCNKRRKDQVEKVGRNFDDRSEVKKEEKGLGEECGAVLGSGYVSGVTTKRSVTCHGDTVDDTMRRSHDVCLFTSPKSGNTSFTRNYRPIAILILFRK